MKRSLPLLIVLAAVVAACGRPAPKAPTYDAVPVNKRDIRVTVEAAGQIEPAVTVELKSKASGQILEIHGETGDVVNAGTLLVQIDKRTPRNSLAQAEAQLEAARARRAIAEAQQNRSDQLLKQKIINDVDFEKTQLELANAKADVVKSQVAVETAKIQLDDTDVRAPITGTIIDKLVEKGQVISSPIMDVGGGTLLLKMADLTTVIVKTLVDETDIGKIHPGQPAIVTVTAFPNQPFRGTVEKVEPQATDNQTVTTFAVRIVLANEKGLLKPGMNVDVEFLVAERPDVLAVPSAALRTDRDITTSAQMVGLDEATVRQQLGKPEGKSDAPAAPPAAAAAGEATGAEAKARAGYEFTNNYWVFVRKDGKPVATRVVTGLTDLDYSEVLEGLKAGDEVYLLPSSGLVETQQRFQQQMKRFTGMPGQGGGKDKPAGGSGAGGSGSGGQGGGGR